MRVLCKIIGACDHPDYNALFGINTILAVSGLLEKGQQFFVEITPKHDIFS